MESKFRKELCLLHVIRKCLYDGSNEVNDNGDDDDDDVKLTFYKFFKEIMR